MAEYLASQLGRDTIICIFPGGHGMNAITGLIKPNDPYTKFIEEISYAQQKAKERGWEFYVVHSRQQKYNYLFYIFPSQQEYVPSCQKYDVSFLAPICKYLINKFIYK